MSASSIDPTAIDDAALYAVTIRAPGEYRLTRFIPGRAYRVRGHVLRQILDIVSSADRIEG